MGYSEEIIGRVSSSAASEFAGRTIVAYAEGAGRWELRILMPTDTRGTTEGDSLGSIEQSERGELLEVIKEEFARRLNVAAAEILVLPADG